MDFTSRAKRIVAEFSGPTAQLLAPEKRLEKIRGYLQNSILVEKAILTPRLSEALEKGKIGIYYGINVSPLLEPLDQIDSLLVCRRLEQWMNQDTVVFVAGKYGVLNAKDAVGLEGRGQELVAREQSKKKLMNAVMAHFELKGEVMLTDEVWGDKLYWEIAGQLYQTGQIGYTRGYSDMQERILFSEVPKTLLGDIPGWVSEALAAERAVDLYSLLEISEALYLRETKDARIKIGPRLEEEYDIYIQRVMDVIHITQAVDLRSNPQKPNFVTPYILRQGAEKNRIVFGDTEADIAGKLEKIDKTPQPIFYSQTLHPLLRLLAYVSEYQEMTGKKLLDVAAILGRPMEKDMLSEPEHEQKKVFERLRGTTGEIAGAIHSLLIEPIRRLMDDAS